jgi:hypothetical protein
LTKPLQNLQQEGNHEAFTIIKAAEFLWLFFMHYLQEKQETRIKKQESRIKTREERREKREERREKREERKEKR